MPLNSRQTGPARSKNRQQSTLFNLNATAGPYGRRLTASPPARNFLSALPARCEVDSIFRDAGAEPGATESAYEDAVRVHRGAGHHWNFEDCGASTANMS